MTNTDSSLMISVPANSGYGQVVHLPILSGDHVAEGDCLVTVKTDIDYFSLRAPKAGRVLTLVKTGQKVTSEEPLVILQTEESLIADQQALSRTPKTDMPGAGTQAALQTKIPDQSEADAKRKAVQEQLRSPSEPRRYIRRRRAKREETTGPVLTPERGGAIDTSLRIVVSILLYIIAAFVVLPDLAIVASSGDQSFQAGVFTAFVGIAVAIWAAVGVRGSDTASRSVGLVAASLVVVAGLTLYGDLPGSETSEAPMSLAQVAEEPSTAAPERDAALPVPSIPPLGTNWINDLARGVNIHSVASGAARHQDRTRTLISRPQMPIYHLSGSARLPTGLPIAREPSHPARSISLRMSVAPAVLTVPEIAPGAVDISHSTGLARTSFSGPDTLAGTPVDLGRALAVLNLRYLGDSSGPVVSLPPASRNERTN